MAKFSLPSNQIFIIAEIANAHNGSPAKFKKLVRKTIQARPDAIKFQLFKATELLIKSHKEFDLFEKLVFDDCHMIDAFRITKENGIKVFTDVFSLQRAEFAQKSGTDGFKVHSSDITNKELLRYLARLDKPILLSCSGCTANEIDEAIRIIRKEGHPQVVLMHGFQGFPTDIKDIHMARIASLRERYNLPVGYSDHIDGGSELSITAPLVGLGFGANIVEKHITLDRSAKDEDYQSSLNPDEFAKMIHLLRLSYDSLGSPSLKIAGSEVRYRRSMKKRIVAARDLGSKQTISKGDITLKRIDYLTPEISEEEVLGATTKRAVSEDTPITSTNALLKEDKVVAAIACRVDSSRLFAKPLQRVTAEKTILDFIIEQLRQAQKINEIVLAVSESPGNEIFVEYARKNDLKFVRGDDFNVLQRLILAAEHVNANIVFRVTSEDPFIYWQIIDSVIEQHVRTQSDFTYTPNLPEGVGFEIINLTALKTSEKRGEKRNKSEFVTSYIHEHQRDFKASPYQPKSMLMRPELRLTVDNPEDLMLVRSIASALELSNTLPEMEKIIALLDAHPELKEINKKYIGQTFRNWL